MKTARTAFAAVAAIALVSAAPAMAEPQSLQVNLEVDYIGFGLGSIRLVATTNGASYSADARVEPSDLTELFDAAEITANVQGIFGYGALAPVEYASQNRKPEKTQLVTIKYDGDRPTSVWSDPPYRIGRHAPTDEQKVGTLDPLSGVVAMAFGTSADDDNPCGTSLPIFDGRRRYDFRLAYIRDVTIDDGDHGYRGHAIECEASYHRVAGFNPNKPRDSETRLHAYFVPVGHRADGRPAFLVPIRLWGDAGLGSVVAEARNVKIDGVRLNDWLAANAGQ